MVKEGAAFVKLDAVNWADSFYAGRTELGARAEPAERYNLATALRIVRRMETSAARSAVFEEIKRKNRLYRLVDSLYARAGSRLMQPLALLLYMLKCAASTSPGGARDAEAVAVFTFGNERHAIERVAALVPDVRLLCISFSRRHMLDRNQLAAVLQMLKAAPRLWPFLVALAKRYSFMPSARMASALAFYMRFSRLFADRPQLHAAVVASNYSPDALGLAAAAHLFERRVIYVNHAPVAANGALVPPVLADCAVFYGDAIRQTYERYSRCNADVALIGQPVPAQPLRWSDDVKCVGIFLTALTKTEAVADLVQKIRDCMPGVRLLIRNHPVALLKSDFTDLVAGDDKVEVTIGNPLEEEIAAGDLIVCGNSGVALNALSGGRPVAYVDSLDSLEFDYNGFVAAGLVCHVPGWSDDIYLRLKRFYLKPRWQSVMRSYDASYGTDAPSLHRSAAARIRSHLGRQPIPSAAEFIAGVQLAAPFPSIEAGLRKAAR